MKHSMKKRTILCCTALILVSISAMLLHKTTSYESFIEENAEALARDESGFPKGRWKTVGCQDTFWSR